MSFHVFEALRELVGLREEDYHAGAMKVLIRFLYNGDTQFAISEEDIAASIELARKIGFKGKFLEMLLERRAEQQVEAMLKDTNKLQINDD